MAKFELYAPTLKKWEGGWSNNPADKGGPTMMGVTLNTYRQYFGKNKTANDLRNISNAEWTKIMKTYWDNCRADEIKNQSVAELIVDWHINAGTQPLKQIQGILGVVQDGIFGPKTIAAINSFNQECLHCKIKKARKAYYENVVRKTPSQAVFLKGWYNRADSFVFKCLIALVFLLASCSPKVIETTKIEYRDKVEYRDRIERDTIYESVREKEYIKGDTIYLETTKYVYKEIIRTDTAYVSRVDSIPYEVSVPVYIEKPFKTRHKILMSLGVFAIIVTAGIAWAKVR